MGHGEGHGNDGHDAQGEQDLVVLGHRNELEPREHV